MLSYMFAIGALVSLSIEALAANSFIMNHGTPTCEKYSKERPKGVSEKEYDYRRDRICDMRWAEDNWPPVWLGSEPPHPKKETPKCKDLKSKYYEAMAGRHLLDNYDCIPPEDGSSLVFCKDFKTAPPPRAEEAAQILEQAVELNCFFY